MLHIITIICVTHTCGSFQPNSNRGVHPMSWIFFLLSIIVDIIETKKFCEFEVSTPFRFRVAAIPNIGGVGAKSESRNERLLKGAISLKLNPLKQWKSLFLAVSCSRFQIWYFQTCRIFQWKVVGVSKWDKLHLDHTLGGHYSKSTNIFIVQNFGASSQYKVFTV